MGRFSFLFYDIIHVIALLRFNLKHMLKLFVIMLRFHEIKCQTAYCYDAIWDSVSEDTQYQMIRTWGQKTLSGTSRVFNVLNSYSYSFFSPENLSHVLFSTIERY